MKSLVVAPNWIGDALMAQPLLERILAVDGEAATVVAPPWVAPLFAAMPACGPIVTADLAHGKLQFARRRELAATLRRHGFGRAYILPNSFKSALVPWMARVPERIGYGAEGRRVLLTRTLPNPGKSLSMVERYAALLPAPGPVPAPRLVLPEGAVENTLARFQLAPAAMRIVLCPGAEFGPAKRWPAAGYAELAYLIQRSWPQAEMLLVGGPGDRPEAEAILALGAPVRSLIGATSLTEAMALIATARAVVSNDSGLMHVAAALGRPQVALFGSTDPRHTPPLSARAQVVWLHVDCSPCFKRECPLGHLKCLREIEPTRVAAVLAQALAS